ncbi:MAG: stage II sporulation protein M [Actinomycetota bacterium]|jgi:uncharacterized membrane protein SpoIIM required for sporulation|nr:stage II sporulation protein M [Actinomycetota bacterium]
MNTDRFIAEHEPRWRQLDELAARPATLSSGEAVLLVDLYRQASTHLSTVRTQGTDPSLVDRLTRSVGNAHTVIHGQRGAARWSIGRFFTETFPAAVWWHRRFIFVSALLFMIPAVTIGAWMAVSAEAVEAWAPETAREAYLNEDFEAYYSSDPAAQFATEVFINNVQVAILAFAAGVLLCVPTAWVLVQNGALLGLVAGLFTAAGRWEHFWGLITPHGLLEITAIIVAGAAGLALGWSIVAPGDRLRSASLADAGKRSVVVVVGLILAFLVAGMIEGFVTGTDLPTLVRVGIGVIALLVFVVWIVALGPGAAERGLTGVFGERPDTEPVRGELTP